MVRYYTTLRGSTGAPLCGARKASRGYLERLVKGNNG